jgi:hypothetical protein
MGGLTNFSPPASGFFLLDHDQRNTLSVGGDVRLPWRSFASTNISYGSGFSDGSNPPHHLPQHTAFDLSIGKDNWRETLRFCGCSKRGEPPSANRQQPDIRWHPLQQSEGDLCRASLPLSLLVDRGRQTIKGVRT